MESWILLLPLLGYNPHMDDKARALVALRDIFNQWKSLLGSLREPELTAPLPGGLSVKDEVAHLRAWQMVTIARLEAAQFGREPVYPDWTSGDPDDEPATDAYNRHIQDAWRGRPWDEVFRAWRDGYLRVLALAEAIPADALTDPARYPWLDGRPLIDVLWGTDEHHREHLAELV